MFRLASTSFAINLCLAAIGNATSYNCSVFVAPQSSVTAIYGINNSGTVSGAYMGDAPPLHGEPNPFNTIHGFIANPSTPSFETVDYPGSSITQLYGINDSGVVVGLGSGGSGGWFTRAANRQFSLITVPSGYTLDSAFGINDNGAISVLVTDPTGARVFGILNSDGTLTPVPTGPRLVNTGPELPGSINIAGQMLETDGIGITYLVDTSGNVTQISVDGFPTVGWGLNNAGLVVGSAVLGSSISFGFSRDPLGVYSGTSCGGRALNDNGLLAGGEEIATPVPGEPAINLSTTNLTFPPTPTGQYTAPQSITITNTGNARLDVITASTALSDFQLSGCGAPLGANIDPGASCTVTVIARPMVQGLRTATLYIADTAAGAPHTVALSVTGTVAPPSCVISAENPGPPEQLTFTMQDTYSGLKSIVLIDATNATASIPGFAPGTMSPVAVTAAQTDPSQSSKIDFQVTNVGGAAATCGETFAGPAQWTSLGGTFNSKIALASDYNGALKAFVRGADNALWTIGQMNPDGGSAGWSSLGGIIKGDPVVVLGFDGRLQVFAVGSDSALWTIAQTSPAGPWGSWASLAGILTSDPAVAVNYDGRLQVFGVGTDQGLWTIAQNSMGGDWADWSQLGGLVAGSPAAALNNDGRLDVFVVGGDGALYYNPQSSPGAGWAGWSRLGGSLTGDPAVTGNADGRLQVFVRGTDGALWTVAQIVAGGWSGFTSLGGIITDSPAVTINADGRLEAFAEGTDSALWHLAQTTAGGNWSNWSTLNGVLAGPIHAATNQSGRVQAFVEGNDSALWTIEQTAAGFWN